MGTRIPEVDRYIDRAEDFAKPILTHLRDLVHKACPEAEEAIKWGMPYFVYRGGLVCGIAAFRKHAAFVFPKASLMKDAKLFGKKGEEGMGHLGRITSMADLPADKVLMGYVKEAAELVEKGVKPASTSRKPASIEVPPYLRKALAANPKAKAVFDGFSPSAKRDYVEWLTEAKSDATRERRLATAIEWIAEGKQRHWKYMKKQVTGRATPSSRAARPSRAPAAPQRDRRRAARR